MKMKSLEDGNQKEVFNLQLMKTKDKGVFGENLVSLLLVQIDSVELPHEVFLLGCICFLLCNLEMWFILSR